MNVEVKNIALGLGAIALLLVCVVPASALAQVAPAPTQAAPTPAPTPISVGGLEPLNSDPSGVTIPVTVQGPNPPKSQIDLGPIFGSMKGLDAQGGLKLTVLGNTDSSLVQAGLSETALTLTYAPGRFGYAKVTICATDEDGVSRQITVVVSVVLTKIPPQMSEASP